MSPPPSPLAVASSSKKCFNAECEALKSRKGWRLNSGAFCELCDRCASTYEEGRFCETFHSNATGWRSCVSCGKRIHCGCIASVHAFILLDAGGIECLVCARKSTGTSSKPAWLSPLLHNFPLDVRVKDFSSKSWCQTSGLGPMPWHPAPSLFAASKYKSDFNPRRLFEIVRLNPTERESDSSLKKEKIEDFVNGQTDRSLKVGPLHLYGNLNAGKNCEDKPNSSLAILQHSSSLKEDLSFTGEAVPDASPNDANGSIRGSATSLCPTTTTVPSLVKQFEASLLNGPESSGEPQVQTGRPLADTCGRNQSLPKYDPRFINEQLQHTAGNSNSVIIPLFEKMLTASDTGRPGRLVLPKKCAEAYLPPISQTGGLALEVQDPKGNKWVFQYRCWPNNKSRMYVLDGITPCLRNMGLQTGDIVTFSRLEPEGKLMMGFRKASRMHPPNQANVAGMRNHAYANGDAEVKNTSTCSELDKSSYEGKEVKRKKNCTLGSKSKRLQIDKQDAIELKLTWKEAQGLICPPCHAPSIVVIEGVEFEEFVDEPVLGDPTAVATDDGGSFPSAAQELTEEHLIHKPACDLAASKKIKTDEQDTDDVEILDMQATIGDLCSGEGGKCSALSHATMNYSQHNLGGFCIDLTLPSSAIGSTHERTETFGACYTLNNAKEAETTPKEQQQLLPQKLLNGNSTSSVNPGNSIPIKENIIGQCADNNHCRMKTSMSCFRGQIDLNIQPDREEESSPNSDSKCITRMVQASQKLSQAPEIIEL